MVEFRFVTKIDAENLICKSRKKNSRPHGTGKFTIVSSILASTKM